MVIVFALIMAAAVLGYDALTESYEPPEELEQSRADEDNNSSESSSAQTPEPVPAPDFTMMNAAGETVKLSDFFGKPIVLNFWASWCGPCKSEMPHFEKCYLEYGEEVEFFEVRE